MFDIGWTELLLVAVIAIVVIGPKDLPRAMRLVGQWTGRMKRMARDFQGQFNEALKEAELDDVKKDVEEIGKGMRADINKIDSGVRDEMKKVEADAKSGLDAADKDKPAPATAKSATEAPAPAAATAPAPEPKPAEAATPATPTAPAIAPVAATAKDAT